MWNITHCCELSSSLPSELISLNFTHSSEYCYPPTQDHVFHQKIYSILTLEVELWKVYSHTFLHHLVLLFVGGFVRTSSSILQYFCLVSLLVSSLVFELEATALCGSKVPRVALTGWKNSEGVLHLFLVVRWDDVAFVTTKCSSAMAQRQSQPSSF